MKQLINSSGHIRQQLLAGLTYTYEDKLNWQKGTGIVTKKRLQKIKWYCSAAVVVAMNLLTLVILEKIC